MSDKQFDDIIRKRVSNWEDKSRPDWETFIQKKELSDLKYNNTQFDTAIKQKINDYNKIPGKGSWKDLNSKFIESQKQKSRVVSLKSLELLILILLLIPLTSHLSWKQIIPNHNFVESVIDREDKIQVYNVTDEVSVGESNLTLNSENFDNGNNSGESSFSSVMNTDENSYQKSIPIVNNNSKKKTGNNNLIEEINAEAGIAEGGIIPAESLSEANPVSLDIINRTQKLNSLNLLQPIHKLLNLGVRNIAIDFSELTGSQEVNFSKAENWFHIYGAIQNNIINSPIDEVYSVANNVSYAPGYSIGLKYSRTFKNFELGTGLFYTKTKYQPYPITETYEALDGIHIISLKEIEYDQFSIPLEIRYHIIDHIEGSLFLSTGLSAHVLWKESYAIEDELDIPLPRPQGSQTQVDPALLMDKRFTTGLSGDLSFKDAFYLRGFVGIGVERNISSTTKFYLSGQYDHQLNNILGPNHDKINLFSFGAGVKIKL